MPKHLALMLYGAIWYGVFMLIGPRWIGGHGLSWAGYFAFQTSPWWRPLAAAPEVKS